VSFTFAKIKVSESESGRQVFQNSQYVNVTFQKVMC